MDSNHCRLSQRIYSPPPLATRALLPTEKWCPDSELNQGHGDFQSPALPTELSGHTFRKKWSGWQDLNPRPTGPKPVALPNCATPRNIFQRYESKMAGVAGLEPTNDGVKVRCLTGLAIPQNIVKKNGEPTGIRTPDTRLRRPLLYPTEL